MKNLYIKPELELTFLDNEDILRTSDGLDGSRSGKLADFGLTINDNSITVAGEVVEQ